jgi:CHAT domain
MNYLDFELDVAPVPQGGYELILDSPAGQARGSMQFPFGELELRTRIQTLQIALLRSGGTRRSGSAEDVAVEQFGRELFKSLFVGEIAGKLEASRAIAGQQGRGVRIKLRISAPELLSLPWEYLFDDARGDYLALASATPVVRYVPLPTPVRPLAVLPPIRILGMTSGPRDLGQLDANGERERLELALRPLKDRGLVELVWVQGERWEDLMESLWHGPWHIFHFIGHGGFSAARGSGIVYMTDERGMARELSATDVGRILGDHDSLRLAVLNSCDTAQGNETDVFSSTAATLVRRGTPAVVAMQFEITDDAAVEFSRVFYSTVAQGMPVDSAVAEARKSVSVRIANTYEWGTPVLFMRSADGVLFDIPPQAAKPSPEAAPPSEVSPPPSVAPPAVVTPPRAVSPPPAAPSPAPALGPAPTYQPYQPYAPPYPQPWTPTYQQAQAPQKKGIASRLVALTVGLLLVAVPIVIVIAIGLFIINMLSNLGGGGILGPAASITLSANGGRAGSQVSVSGDGFQANETVELSVGAIEVDQTRADGSGSFQNFQITIPEFYANFPSGTPTQIIASGTSSQKSDSAPYTLR